MTSNASILPISIAGILSKIALLSILPRWRYYYLVTTFGGRSNRNSNRRAPSD